MTSPIAMAYGCDSVASVDGQGEAVDGRGEAVEGQGKAAKGQGKAVDGRGEAVEGRGKAAKGRGEAVERFEERRRKGRGKAAERSRERRRKEAAERGGAKGTLPCSLVSASAAIAMRVLISKRCATKEMMRTCLLYLHANSLVARFVSEGQPARKPRNQHRGNAAKGRERKAVVLLFHRAPPCSPRQARRTSQGRPLK